MISPIIYGDIWNDIDTVLMVINGLHGNINIYCGSISMEMYGIYSGSINGI